MLKLVDVSKYYQSDKNITLALQKINLEFKLGEFVAITGESGSGKTTLLNVISGIDSYEEGELYINGEETSYFDEEDLEKYRNEKVAFIFQNYNLIDSYSVLKNVEAALVIQGIKRKERIKKAKEIIEKVGLSSHIRHKASKLSGGQKQRLAIARALAKDVDIIVADEPTGNLDSKTGEEIIKLLAEIAKDKLVIMVTHNYEQVAPYVTRKIRLYDGKVVEDVKIKEVKEVEIKEKEKAKINEFSKAINLSWFNLFSQPKRTFFIFIISLAVILYVFYMYSLIINPKANDNLYSNTMNIYQNRMIVMRKDLKPLTNDDYQFFLNDKRINNVIADNDFVDAYLNSFNDSFYFNGRIIFNLKYTADSLIGRLPNGPDEILLEMVFADFEKEKYENEVLNKKFAFTINNVNKEYTVVGINQSTTGIEGYYLTFAGIEKLIELYQSSNYLDFKCVDENGYFVENKIFLYLVDESLSGYNVKISQYEILNMFNYSLYYNDIKLNVQYIKTDMSLIYISKELHSEIINITRMKFTLNLKNVLDRNIIEKDYLKHGYYTYMPYYEYSNNKIYTILDSILSSLKIVGLFLCIFFIFLISYQIYKFIFNAKIVDYAILRIIGAKRSLISKIIGVELIIANTFAYLVFLVSYFLLIKKFNAFLTYFRLFDYVLIYLINFLLALLIARRFIKRQVNKTLYQSLKVE